MQPIPTREEVCAHIGNESHLVVSVELLADAETPISLYRKLAAERPFSFLLESAEGGETVGRYSFIGFDPTIRFHFSGGHGVIVRNGVEEDCQFEDPLRVIKELLQDYHVASQPGLPPLQGGAVGYLAYECVRYFEAVPTPGNENTPLSIPEGYFMLSEQMVVVDHLRHRVVLVDHVPLGGDRAKAYDAALARLQKLYDQMARSTAISLPRCLTSNAPQPENNTSNMTRARYEDAVSQAKEAIRAGEIFQVALSQRLSTATDLSSFELYRVLRALNPSPYMFHLKFGDWAVVGASPEVLVRLEGRDVLLRPIAGTRKRGSDAAEDRALEKDLLSDEKELAEHMMLVDLGRNDVGRVCEIGTVRVEDPLHIERYSHVMHIVSDIRGTLQKDKDAFDLLRASFPAGTVSGAPKIRAMEIIAALEPTPRGLYSGAVGYFDFQHNMDTCIAIRTMVVKNNQVDLQVGAGIVHDSDPPKEFQECLNKARAGLVATSMAKTMTGEIP